MKNKLRFIYYMLSSFLPVSRRRHNKLNLQMLEIFAAQRELTMLTRQDIMLLANKMVSLHKDELIGKKDLNDKTIAKTERKMENNHMYE